MKDKLYIKVFKMVVVYSLGCLLCRLSSGYFTLVVALIGSMLAFRKRIGLAFSGLIFLTFISISNPILIPKESVAYVIGMRIGSFVMMLAIVMSCASLQTKWRLPLGMLFAFLGVAVISSAVGWAPNISYMKLIQFVVFLLCVSVGSKGFKYSAQNIDDLRISILALAVIVTFGSIALYPFPEVSSLDALKLAREVQHSSIDVELIVQDRIASGMGVYFCGVTNQSQALAPVLSCLYIFVLCDALFVEREFKWLHSALLLCMLPLFYLTRSRVGMFSLLVGIIMVVFYAGRCVVLPKAMMRRVHFAIAIWLFLILSAAIIGEVKGDALSKWVRKTNDLSVDRRSFFEAVSASRQGLVDYCLWEFQQNPLIGKGFQTSYQHKLSGLDRSGWLIFSAPIEKGVLPLMVLGETGVVGLLVFTIFLLSFYITCHRKKMIVTVALFTVLLATNMGEAGFFSPGAEGGLDWILCVVGGFVIDTIIINRQNFYGHWFGRVC